MDIRDAVEADAEKRFLEAIDDAVSRLREQIDDGTQKRSCGIQPDTPGL